jgi:hypothetical protein
VGQLVDLLADAFFAVRRAVVFFAALFRAAGRLAALFLAVLFFAAVFFAVDFLAAPLRAVFFAAFFAVDFLAADFFAAFLAVDFFAAVFLAVVFLAADFFAGLDFFAVFLAVDFFAAVFLAVDRLAGDLLLGAVMRCASSEQSRWNHPSLQTNLTVSDARRQYGAPTSFVATATRRRHATRVIVVLIARNPLRRRCFRCVINTQWRRSTPLTGSKNFAS